MAPRPPSEATLNRLAKLRLSRLLSGKMGDDTLINFRCPRCRQNTIFARETANTPLRFDFYGFLERKKELAGLRATCTCGAALEWNEATAIQHDHFFPGVQRDLQVVTWGGKDRLLFRMNLQGARQPLPGGIDEDGLREDFDLPKPVHSTWFELLKHGISTGECTSVLVEKGHVLVALPGNEEEQIKSELGKVSETGEFIGRAYAVRLESPRWAGEFSEDIARGRLQTFALFDPQTVKSKINNTIEATGVRFTTGPDYFTVYFGDFNRKLAIGDVMELAAMSPTDIAQSTMDLLAEVNEILGKVADMYAEIAWLAPDCDLTTDGKRAYISDPASGNKAWFDIYDWAERNVEGDELRSLVEGLVGRVASNQPPIRCSCGKSSWIGKHLRSRHWLDGENSTVAHRKRGDAVEIYTVECSEHFTPLHDDDLKRAGVDMDDLDNFWVWKLEQNPLNLWAGTEGSGRQQMLFVMGFNASDLALHPGLLASLFHCLEIKLDPKHPNVNMYIPTTNSIVLYLDATFDQLRRAFERCRELELEFPGEHGEEVNFFDRMLVISGARGRLNVNRFPEKEK